MANEWSPTAPRVHVVRPVPVDPTGRMGPTKGQARGPHWRRTSENLYVPSSVQPGLVEQRIVEQGARVRRGAITGWAALRLLGGGYFDGLAPDGRTPMRVPIAANGDRLTSGRQAHVRRVAIEEAEVVIRYGVRCAGPEWALFDAVRWADTLEDKVTAIDMAAAAELTSLRRLWSFVMSCRHVHGRWRCSRPWGGPTSTRCPRKRSGCG